MMRHFRILTILAFTACTADDAPPPSDDTAAVCDDARVRDVVEQLGSHMRNVSLLAPDSIVEASIREQYTDIVSAELLERWLADPTTAPGRQTSSPWPARIEIASVRAGNGGCDVIGEIQEVTNTDTTAAVSRLAVTLTVDSGARRIRHFERAGDGDGAPADTATDDAQAAADVVRQYYAAIDARDFGSAWRLWSDSGAASGQSLDEFTRGFERTASVSVEVGEPGRIEGAAGSRYIELPVVIRARTTDGEDQRFEGSYTLRRSVVDGATDAQRAWRIQSASIARTNEGDA